jgi:hypothetical protein
MTSAGALSPNRHKCPLASARLPRLSRGHEKSCALAGKIARCLSSTEQPAAPPPPRQSASTDLMGTVIKPEASAFAAAILPFGTLSAPTTFSGLAAVHPQGKNKKGGEIMMMITIIISALSVSAMLAGFVVMVRD